MTGVFVVDYARSPFAQATKGASCGRSPRRSGCRVIRAVASRATFDINEIEDVILGCAFPEVAQFRTAPRARGRVQRHLQCNRTQVRGTLEIRTQAAPSLADRAARGASVRRPLASAEQRIPGWMQTRGCVSAINETAPPPAAERIVAAARTAVAG